MKPSNSFSFLTWVWRALGAVAIFGIIWTINSQLFPRLNGYYQIIAINAGIAIILAVSLNLINGITGQFSLGHAGFMAIGAYTSAYFTKTIGAQLQDPVAFSIGIVVAALAAGLAGLFVGLPSLRLRGDYLAIVTLGFNQIIVSVIRNIKAVGGASGFTGIPQFTTFAWVLGLAFLCILTVRNLADSQFGRAMRAVRDDEVAAEASGVNTTRIKVLAFVFSSMWAGVAGALQAHFIQYANPSDFTFLRSIDVVVSVVLGGLGSITGSALAAAGLRVLEEVLREVPGVFWTGICLTALAMFWSFQRSRPNLRQPLSLLRWLATPTFFLALLFGMRYFPAVADFLNHSVLAGRDSKVPANWFQTNKGSLRYIVYSLILIVLMLLRPQGLLGRLELSFRRRRFV